MGYFLYEFKKAKLPTFDGEVKKLEDAKTWLLRVKKFIFPDYFRNMKAKITIFSLKGKQNV